MFAIIIAAALSSTTPAAAAAPAASAPAPTATPAKAYNPRVCVMDYVTGSHIRQRECRTLANWRENGIDPLPGR